MTLASRWTCLALLALGLLGAAGCGSVNESNFSATPGTAPADAPQSPEEYDARFPIQDKGSGSP